MDSLFSFYTLSWIDNLYTIYKEQPQLLPKDWQDFFATRGLEQRALSSSTPQNLSTPTLDLYISYVRQYGHLHVAKKIEGQAIHPAFYKKIGTPPAFPLDISGPFPGFPLSLRSGIELQKYLEKIYLGNIGFEYIPTTPSIETWVQNRLEKEGGFASPSSQEQKSFLQGLMEAEYIENFFQVRYTGHTRFSLEGGETLIPMLQKLCRLAVESSMQEIAMGVAHRGRLNILKNIFQMPLQHFVEMFEETAYGDSSSLAGDVKYHKGGQSLVTIEGKKLQLTLLDNPSHLEAVVPVLAGYAYGKAEIVGKEKLLPIVIHGDAAIAGQGVVYETLQLSSLEGYGSPGTIHIVINNRLGFTASPKETRSTLYCTDIAKTFSLPVFHVRAEDIEECIQVISLAFALRQNCGCDVVIDFQCSRKYGHNEGDEPFYTQPLEYFQAKGAISLTEKYKKMLQEKGILAQVEMEKLQQEVKERIEKQGEASKVEVENSSTPVLEPLTVVKLQKLIEKMYSPPFPVQNLHPKIARLWQERLKTIQNPSSVESIDWAFAEQLLMAYLVDQKVDVRLSGQDSARGTFSQRHAIVVDQKTGEKKSLFSSFTQAKEQILNSCLSEYGVLGFEFGLSLAKPQGLSIWEAQYGDFANGAQIILDQFLSTSFQKWSKSSRLVLFLPHGYEGKGPEHSSARIERFLTLSSQNNWKVVQPTLPHQLFSLLLQQVMQPEPIPLVIFTPKALLRHPGCITSLDKIATASFAPLLIEEISSSPEVLLLCSGKVFYALRDFIQQNRALKQVFLVRVEQLYPFPHGEIEKLLEKYPSIKEIRWVQEEPENMGAWSYYKRHPWAKEWRYIGKESQASPAVGSYKRHEQEQKKLIKEAFQ